MAEVKQFDFDDSYCLSKYDATSERQSKCPHVALRGIKIPLYRFGSKSFMDNGSCGDFSCTEEQNLLDSLLLAQWEDCAWKGLLRYDVTTCETKIIGGRRKFVVQLNEGWNLNYFPELEESNVFQQVPYTYNCIKTQREQLLFCVANGEKANPEFIHSSTVPNGAILIIVNVNPVEYGHVFLVPLSFCSLPQSLDARSLEMVTQVAVEINNCSFRIFYNCANHLYFQACYFASPLPLELMPVMTVYGDWKKRGLHISEVLDYPIKALSFKSDGNMKVLFQLVAEICFCLQDQNIPYGLLISDRGTRVFLFPQELAATLSAWECGGHIVFKTRDDFDQATEETLLERLSAVSLDDESFRTVKQLCCNVASKLAS